MRVLTMLALVASLVPFCAAGQYTWAGIVNGTWSASGNWLNGNVPPNDGTAVVQFQAGMPSATSIVDVAWNIRTLDIGGPPSHTVSGLPLTFSGPSPTLIANGTGHLVNNSIMLDGELTATVSAGSVITLSGLVSGSGGIQKAGTGTLILSGPTAYGGWTNVNGGLLRLAGTGLIGTVNVSALGTLEIASSGSVNVTSPVSGPGNVVVSTGTATGVLLHTGLTEVSAPGQFTGSISNASRLTLDGTFSLNAPSNIGSLAGSGTLGLGANNFSTGSDNTPSTYLGTINGTGAFAKVGSAELILGNTAAISPPVAVGGGTLTLGDGTQGPAQVDTVLTQGVLRVNHTATTNFVNPITGNGSFHVQKGGSTGSVNINGALTVETGTSHGGAAIMSGAATINGTLTATDITVASLAGNGLVDASNSLTVGSGNTDSSYSGNITGAPDFTKVGTGTLTLAGASMIVDIPRLQAGTLLVDGGLGCSGNTAVFAGATLGGAGTVTCQVVLLSNGNLSPGNGGTGTLTTGALSLSGNVLIEIDGATGQFDSLNAPSVALGGATLQLSGTYPAAGGTITIVDNTGGGPVSGTFATLPEGATLTLGGRTLRISYVGGTGNDIVLSPVQHTVTASAGPNGTISPLGPRMVDDGDSFEFTVTPNVGYTAVVGGTCGGMLVGDKYTTNAITGPCSVEASFTQITYTVTPTFGANGTITPSTPQVVGHGGSLVFTVAPNLGYEASMAGTCAGTLAGNTYTIDNITANCTVDATFVANPTRTHSGASPTGTGTITASFTSTDPACTFTHAQFIPVEGGAGSPPAGTKPADVSFPHGLFDFRIGGCLPGAEITMTVTYPLALPASAQYWKYGPTPTNGAGHWYVLPATIAGNTATFTIRDGELGDDDLNANGEIIDQGGPGAGTGGPVQTPTLSQWALVLLSMLMLAAGLRRARRR